MTVDELKDKAQILVQEIPFEDGPLFLELLFDEFCAAATQSQIDEMNSALLAIGIDFGPICKKKRPQ